MFKRRKQQPVHHRVGNLIWPRIGFRRSATYVWHRIGRLHGTPHSIAGGFAAGAAVSFTPFVGGHFILAAIVALMTRSNVVAALLGTAVGNPWTFPFIWFWIYDLGRRMGVGGGDVIRPDFVSIFTDLPGVAVKAAISLDVDAAYLDNVWAVLWPMMIGSIPTFIAVWMVFYFVLRPVVASYQMRRIARRHRKQQKLLEKQREKERLRAAADEPAAPGDVDRDEPETPIAREANG